MREQVFEPLGMARCQVGRWSVRDVGNVAQPHARRDGRTTVVNADGEISADLPSMAAGGIRCSLRDMTRWMQVLLDPDLVPDWLDTPQRRALWTLHMPMPLGDLQRRWDNAHVHGYGYGWRLSDIDGHWKVAHTGTLSGMYSSLALLPDRGIGVVILINGEGEQARTALMQSMLKAYTAPQDRRRAADYLDELERAQASSVRRGMWRLRRQVRAPYPARPCRSGRAAMRIRGWEPPGCAQAPTACGSAWRNRLACRPG